MCRLEARLVVIVELGQQHCRMLCTVSRNQMICSTQKLLFVKLALLGNSDTYRLPTQATPRLSLISVLSAGSGPSKHSLFSSFSSSIQNSRGSQRFPIKRLARGEDKWNVTICEGCRERPLTTSLDTHSSRRSRMNLETSIEVSLYDWLG